MQIEKRLYRAAETDTEDCETWIWVGGADPEMTEIVNK